VGLFSLFPIGLPKRMWGIEWCSFFSLIDLRGAGGGGVTLSRHFVNVNGLTECWTRTRNGGATQRGHVQQHQGESLR
jgi:hypothetical protein